MRISVNKWFVCLLVESLSFVDKTNVVGRGEWIQTSFSGGNVGTSRKAAGSSGYVLNNLRPISLNTDYKIATEALAKRLEQILPQSINADQTG